MPRDNGKRYEEPFKKETGKDTVENNRSGFTEYLDLIG